MSRGANSPTADRGRRAARRLIGPAIMAAIIWTVLGVQSSGASLDDQVYAISRQLMCPVCQGQTVAESDAPLAREMKAIIRQKLLAGEAPDQIVRYFVGQFGEAVLAEPRAGGVSLILYAGPPLALVTGVAIALIFLRRAGRRAGSPDGPDRETASEIGR